MARLVDIACKPFAHYAKHTAALMCEEQHLLWPASRRDALGPSLTRAAVSSKVGLASPHYSRALCFACSKNKFVLLQTYFVVGKRTKW